MNKNDVSYSEAEADSKLDAEICLSVLIASEKLPAYADIKDADYYYRNLGADCNNCEVKNKCYLFIKNE